MSAFADSVTGGVEGTVFVWMGDAGKEGGG